MALVDVGGEMDDVDVQAVQAPAIRVATPTRVRRRTTDMRPGTSDPGPRFPVAMRAAAGLCADASWCPPNHRSEGVRIPQNLGPQKCESLGCSGIDSPAILPAMSSGPDAGRGDGKRS